MDSCDLVQEFFWVGGFGFICYVLFVVLFVYEKKMCEDCLLFFGIIQLVDNFGDCYVIEYIEFFVFNWLVFGLDIVLLLECCLVVDYVMLIGCVELIMLIRLVQKEGWMVNVYLFLLFIYVGLVMLLIMEQCQERIFGWVYVLLLVYDIFFELSWCWNMYVLEILVEDVVSNIMVVELFCSGGFDQIEDVVSLEMVVFFYGWVWKLSFCVVFEYVQVYQFISDCVMLFFCIMLVMLILVSVLVYQVFFICECKLQEVCVLLVVVVDSLFDVIVIIDVWGLIILWNWGVSDILGLFEGCVLGMVFFMYVVLCELDQQGSICFIFLGFSFGISQQEEFYVISLQGELICYVLVLMFLLCDGVGWQIGKVFMLCDIICEKCIECQLYCINEELELIVQQCIYVLYQVKIMLQIVFNVMFLLVGYWDKYFINCFVNVFYECVFGCKYGEIIGMYMFDLVGMEFYESVLFYIDVVLVGEK